MNPDLVLLALRLVFAGLLYLFLMQVILALRRDLRSASTVGTHRAPVLGRLAVVESESSLLVVGQLIDLQTNTALGRDPRNDIVLDDSFVSASHARLLLSDGRWLVQDLGSTNGTFLNRRQIREATPVTVGDVLEIGRSKFKFVM